VATTAYRTVTEFTATAGQTSFSVPSYTAGYINVYRNGALLGTSDYTATSGTTVVLANPASSGDLVVTESFFVSSVLNAIPAVANAVTTSYINNGAITAAKMAASGAWAPVGTVIQVVQSVKTSLQSMSTTAGTYYDISDLSVSITPSSSSNKILVMFNIGACGTNSTGDLVFRLNRNATVIGIGQSATFNATAAIRTLNAEISSTPTMTLLDSPATTSSITYKVTAANTSNGTLTINGRQADSAFCAVSSITVMEIAA
jgi:hypothetical protein